ncbi:formamidopyrimidine-DNA glycosylase [Thermodesulfobacterium geofontis OPF15]|jgi:formamidopyrimidine-DNA glycosylase|uniref:Formamidopyrimidine-DNA glycosylase n=1 Tax=Thermodesulfobacterium geofontis (strain OPF15) TaxID=795359 RepID=F8C234_THEGP|nr:bifunctional DNA-formamidopyrimidine glycosylase/DNA-(apurinic or apyrimidinic site) lyase [Thermodesulfobacterium geofontis]AEH22186.1 formamidopyrimidine-DNA glycosylase [Thermodesulfobacterium geofontis OPF15]
MPELPEVETIKLGLEDKLIGQKLKNIVIFNQEFILKNKIQNLDTIVNTKLISIKRKGKYLIFFFEKEFLLFHLGLTGAFFLFNDKKDEEKITIKKKKHFILGFHFEKYKLIYFDIRKFGKIKMAKIEEISTLKELKNLGKDALEIDFEEFKTIILKRNRNIKNLLMDQKVISGLGNIYVNELLFRAQISPFKNSKDLKEEEIKNLFFQMKELLKEAISFRGSSIKNYVDVQGKKGEFQNRFLVYGKKNNVCPKCGEKLKYQKLFQRGTFYCPNCQYI